MGTFILSFFIIPGAIVIILSIYKDNMSYEKQKSFTEGYNKAKKD